MRKGFLKYEEMREYFPIHDFATAPFWISLYMRKIWFSFSIVYNQNNFWSCSGSKTDQNFYTWKLSFVSKFMLRSNTICRWFTYVHYCPRKVFMFFFLLSYDKHLL
jgi:hypothetical protein